MYIVNDERLVFASFSFVLSHWMIFVYKRYYTVRSATEFYHFKKITNHCHSSWWRWTLIILENGKLSSFPGKNVYPLFPTLWRIIIIFCIHHNILCPRWDIINLELTARINVFTSRVISSGLPTCADMTHAEAAKWKLSVFISKIDFWWDQWCREISWQSIDLKKKKARAWWNKQDISRSLSRSPYSRENDATS
jgi:hypothetical protein